MRSLNHTNRQSRPMTIKLSENESLRAVVAAFKVRQILAAQKGK